MLAHLLGDGSFVKNQPIRYASIDEENLAAVSTAAEHFGIYGDSRLSRSRAVHVAAAAGSFPAYARST